MLTFKHFSPIKGRGPETLSLESSDIIARARDLLQTRSYKELQAALRAINWMIGESLEGRGGIGERLRKEAEALDTGVI